MKRPVVVLRDRMRLNVGRLIMWFWDAAHEERQSQNHYEYIIKNGAISLRRVEQT